MSDMEKKWQESQKKIKSLKKEIGRVIVGQDQIIEQMLTALFSSGHCLLIGVPGLAKTLLVSTLGKTLGLRFNRIQFTPDMMPTDIIGSEILQTANDGSRHFEFVRGPVFANLILADEINRTPPKTQSALLEAMQERQVTANGKSMALPDPFVVFATQNPIEHEGTYPLPEAQLDRFFFSLKISYPSMDEERKIIETTTGSHLYEPQAVMSLEDVKELQELCGEIPVPENVVDYILKLVHSSRPGGELADDYINRYVEWGGGPRASQTLTRAAKALTMLRGKTAVTIDEVREVAMPVLSHRVIPNYNATGDGVAVGTIIQHLLDNVDKA